MILAIDSSLPLLSVALIEGERTLGALSVRGEASRNEKLLPAVDWLLREAGHTIEQVMLYAVTRGPGSFTGIRIGLATVQGIARASGRPVCAMSTLHAASFDGSDVRTMVVGDAGRGESYAATYAGIEELDSPAIVSREEVQRRASDGVRVVDLRSELDGMNVALGAARLALALESAGRLSRYADAVPLYVRMAEPDVRRAREPE